MKFENKIICEFVFVAVICRMFIFRGWVFRIFFEKLGCV